MPKQYQKTSTAGNSHSYIFSDASRAIYRQQSLTRKLKHLQQENTELQEKIKEQQDEIKDERTVIIYQMGELAKAVAGKLNVFEDFVVKRDMFVKDGQEVHDGLKLLIQKFQDIEKQARMVSKVGSTLQKMHEFYTEHKESIEQMMQQSTSLHQQTQQKLRSQIHQKKLQVQLHETQNSNLTSDIARMKHQMQQFEQEEPILDELEVKLMKEIQDKEREIQQQVLMFGEISRWAEIVVDRKVRAELMEEIRRKGKLLGEVKHNRDQIEIALREHTLRAGKS